MTIQEITERIAAIRHEADLCFRRHKERYGPQVDAVIGTFQNDYDAVCRETTAFLDNGTEAEFLLRPVREHVATLLQRNGWNGWTLCDLAPPLGITHPGAYACALLAYNALHFLDDGIDGHLRYEAIQTDSLYGRLLDDGLGERQAAAVSGMIGMALLNETVRLLLGRRETEAADTLLRLSCRVYTGMVGESLAERPLTAEAYHHLVAYKSVAYQMFLDHIFFREVPMPLRSHILGVNAGLVRLAQLVDDLADEAGDLADGCMTILAVQGMDRGHVLCMATEALERVWTDVLSLPDGPRDATATRLVEWIRLLQQHLPEPAEVV